ncbi:HNH endonuclease signature motif containing protein [Microbacterium sp. T2.11-28]|uniref:HNH endonuclease signature motif containing protein n=1 Tax=Microbacterium sp. T2.11-28 TaxID=3041169 RepID=UPI002477BEB7|nr:HNH endonuclease signature motif containing protein [Microbacterium sp. T2.11-28]CAI9387089.1 hypothetical protein MICABA_00767 [Microbacterium sp. T2.11-28]
MTGISASDPGVVPPRVDALLDALADAERTIAAAQARKILLLAEAVEMARAQAEADGAASSRDADIPMRSMAAQIGASLRHPDRSVQRELSDAFEIVTRFPATLTALADGSISRAHLEVVVDAGTRIDDDQVRREYEDAALAIARREAPGRLRPAAKLLASRLHPVPLNERHAVAAKGRSVWVRDLDDGMAELIATLPAAIAHGIKNRLDQIARQAIDARGTVEASPLDEPTPIDSRSAGEVRTDVLTDLLLTGHASPEVTNGSLPEREAIVAQVQITVPVLTLLGAGTAPAELVGHSPIDTATALRLAGTATGWDRVLTHPITGSVVAVDRYRPSDQLRRFLRVRDEHCRFPGCRMPTARCDVDHTIARAHDGPTELGNLAHLCRRHHTLKHHSAWRVRQSPDGVLHWTSPTGRVYPDRPARTLFFTTGDPSTGDVTERAPF